MEKRTVIDAQICNLLNARDPQGMKLLFQTYYKPLVSYANTLSGIYNWPKTSCRNSSSPYGTGKSDRN